MPEPKRWPVVAVFAAAMAWVEAAAVTYLRTLVNRIDPWQPNPLPEMGGLGQAELVREVATLLMLVAVGCLAGRTWRHRLGYMGVAFGLWDILYYLFLRALAGWPRSLFDWDILFLLPLPWWGPVLAPVLIALLMVAGGTLVVLSTPPDRPLWPRGWTIALGFCGTGLALYVFMADAISVAGQGIAVLRDLLPVRFPWPLFLVALAFMATPVVDLTSQLRRVGRDGSDRTA